MDLRTFNLSSCPALAATTIRLAQRALVVLIITPGLALAAAGEGSPAVAPAPTFATPSDGMPLLRVLLALILVLGAVYAAAKLSRRMGVTGGAPAQRLAVVAQTALGPRERAVILRIGEREVLLGVATGNVRLLLDLQDRTAVEGPTSAAAPAAPGAAANGPTAPTFRTLLMKSLGR